MSDLLDISIVICAYTQARWDDLVACIDSVQRQTFPCKEIIIVVDHNPELLDRVRSHQSAVIAIPNREPRGLAGARNTGIHAASGTIIAFLDDDAEAVPDWLAQLADGYADPQVLGVGGSIEPVWGAGRPRWFPEEFDWVVGCTYRGLPETKSPVRNLIGCNMSFRKRVVETIGGFQIGMGGWTESGIACEETEFCIRMRQQSPGQILLYEPRALVHHKISPERATGRYFLSRCYAEGRSKAIVARLVGSDRALESERAFVLKTLTRGIATGIAQCMTRRDPTGVLRAVAIVIGLLSTGLGYFRGMLAERMRMDKMGSKILSRV